MSEQGFREIQLTGKQLVFLFMASVVVAVAIFLLGISVGRGVRAPTLETAAGTTAVDVASARDAAPPAVMPPPTTVTSADRAYHDALQGQTPPAAVPANASAATADPATGTSAVSVAEVPAPVDDAGPPAGVAAAVPAAKSTVTPTTKSAASAAAPTTKAPAVTPAPGNGWFVQVGAFKSRDNADHLVARLKSKGYAAFVLSTTSATVPFHVRVGPFADRADADRSSTRLQREEGFKPSVTR